MKRMWFYVLVTFTALVLGYGTLFVLGSMPKLYEKFRDTLTGIEKESLNQALEKEFPWSKVEGRIYRGQVSACFNSRDTKELLTLFAKSTNPASALKKMDQFFVKLVLEGKCVDVPNETYTVMSIEPIGLMLEADRNPRPKNDADETLYAKRVMLGIAMISVRGVAAPLYQTVFLPAEEV